MDGASSGRDFAKNTLDGSFPAPLSEHTALSREIVLRIANN
jgi:hypothetical protein